MSRRLTSLESTSFYTFIVRSFSMDKVRFTHKLRDSVTRFLPPIFSVSIVCGPILGISKSLTDTWMWKLGLRPRNSQKITKIGFSLQCVLCCRYAYEILMVHLQVIENCWRHYLDAGTFYVPGERHRWEGTESYKKTNCVNNTGVIVTRKAPVLKPEF